MPSAPDVPRDGPAEVLAEFMRRRGPRFSRAHVRALLSRQTRPGSLLALVAAARELGFEATAGQGDLETLDSLEADALPVLLHFQDGDQGGFGLLEAVTPTTFRLWDSRSDRHEVAREVFAARWSGVVVFLERDGVGEPEPWRRLHLARERLLEDWRLKTALAGPESSVGMRGGLVLLLALALGASVLGQAPEWRWPTALLSLLAALGGAASLAALTWTRGGLPSFICGGGGPLDCASVLQSPWARPAGVPLAGLGTAFFGSQLLLLCTPTLGAGVAPVWLVGAAFLPSLLLSGALAGVQVRMHRVCTLCMAVHAVVLSGAALFLLAPWPGGLSPPEGVLPAALLGGLFFALLLSTLVPLVSRGDADAAALQEHARLLRSPLTTLARLSLEPPLSLDGESLGPRLGEADAPHTLVVFAHPACAHCGPVLDALEALVAQRGDQVRAYVALAPMDPTDAGDVAACEALVAAGLAWGGERFLQHFRAAKGHYQRLRLAEEPLALVAADSGASPGALAWVRPQARARVDAALAFKRRHVQGLPTVFLDGRRCEAPLSHVAAWLDAPSPLGPLSPSPRSPSWHGAHAP